MKSERTVEEFVKQLNTIKEPISAVVTIHLYTEYWLDVIIKNKTKTPSKILNWSYASKLQVVYNIDLITEELYLNLIKLNKLRNTCAHNLYYDFKDINFKEYTLYNMDEKISDINTDDKMFHIAVIGISTFGWLSSYAREELGLIDDPIE